MGVQEQLEAGRQPTGGTGATTALVAAMRPMDESSAALLYSASHTMRIPLIGIVGFTEVLAEGGAGATSVEQQRRLWIIARSASGPLRIRDSFDRRIPGAHTQQAGPEPRARRRRPEGHGFRG